MTSLMITGGGSAAARHAVRQSINGKTNFIFRRTKASGAISLVSNEPAFRHSSSHQCFANSEQGLNYTLSPAKKLRADPGFINLITIDSQSYNRLIVPAW